MYAVDECLGVSALDVTDEFCHGTVGQQHKLLDQLVGILRLLEEYTDRVTFFIYVKAHLHSVET